MILTPTFAWNLIDLTQTITPASTGYEEDDACTITTTLDYQECQTTTKFRVQNISMPLGMGTHIDAPAHAHRQKPTIEKLSPQDLFFPLIIINSTTTITKELEITTNTIHEFEGNHGAIPSGCFVYMYTGWAQYWDQPKYRNKKDNGTTHYPTLSKNAVDLLVARNIGALGIDTLSPDKSPDFYTHEQLLSRNIPIIENLAEPNGVTSTGNFVGVFPLKIMHATESPARVIAFVKNKHNKYW